MPWTGPPRQSVVPVSPTCMSTMNAAPDIQTLQLRGGAVVECGVVRSRVVMFTAIRLQGPEFNPRPGQKFENENFCFRRTPAVVKTFHPCRVRPIKTPLYKTLLPILLKVIHCNYCLNSCKTLSCSCRKNGLLCISASGPCQVTKCNNPHNKIPLEEHGDEDD